MPQFISRMKFKVTKEQIRNQSAWLIRHGGNIIALLKNYEKRMRTLEKRLRPKSQRRDSWGLKCDAPTCDKKRTFECGENIYGQIGGWCSEEHFKKFIKN